MASNIPFYRGKDVVLKFYQNGKPVTLLAKNWSVEEDAVEAADGVNGEDRDRLDKVTNFYRATVDIFLADQEVMQAIIDAQVPDDASTLPLKQTGAIQIRHRDGTKAAYLLKEMKAGPFTKNQGGRTDPVMLTLKMRFRYFSPVQTI